MNSLRVWIFRSFLSFVLAASLGILSQCTQPPSSSGNETTNQQDGGQQKDSTSSENTTSENTTTEASTSWLPDVPTSLFPCGPFGVCGDTKSSAPCGMGVYTPSTQSCTTSDGSPGICCTYPGPCGLGGYCRPSQETTCRTYYQSSPQQTCPLDKSTQSQCCVRVESSRCDPALASSLLSMTGTFLPTGLTRILLSIKAAQLPPTWFLEQPIIYTAPSGSQSWNFERIQFSPQNNQLVEIQLGYNGFEPLQPLTVVLLAFLKITKSGLPDEMQCTASRTWNIQFKANGSIDIQ